MKQTAVEFLVNTLTKREYISDNDPLKEVIEQAKEMEKENQKHIGQITEKRIIDTIGNCANCGFEFHIHKDVTQKQQEQDKNKYSDEEVLEIIDSLFHMYASSFRIDAKEHFLQFKKK